MKPLLQAETAECGLACIAMVAQAHGLNIDLFGLRRRFPQTSHGTTLRKLVAIAAEVGLSSRPVRLGTEYLSDLSLPCILHWDMNHFVVLKRVTRKSVVILDPAIGMRRLPIGDVSRHFTGIALELTRNAEFQPAPEPQRRRLAQLTGKVIGLKRSIAEIAAVALALELFAIVAPLFNQLVVDEVVTSGDHELLGVLVLGFALLLVIQTVLSLARSWMVLVLGQTLRLQWASNVFAHLVRLPADFFEKRRLGDIVSRFGSVDAIQRTLTTSIVEAVLDGFMAVSALVMMLFYAPALAAVAFAAVLAYGVLRWVGYQPFREAGAEKLIVEAREKTHFLETVRAITTLKLFGREDERRARWQNLFVDVQNRDARTAKMNIGFAAANALIFGAENLIVLWLGARLLMSSQASVGTATFTIGMLFAFMSYKNQFTSRVSALINYAVDLKMLSLYADRLADIVLMPIEKDNRSGEGDSANAPIHDLSHLRPSLELRDVSFRYGDGEPWILRNANFVASAGESVAVTGPSGCGKTTLLKLLLGLLNPVEGEVLYGGLPVRQIGIANVRRQFGTVMQDDMLLTGSIAENICFFDVEPDEARIETCAKLAQVHAEIVKMPMGYQTHVGDLGTGLSGGQKQRLLLARALYKQPRVLALDEATSHLDVVNERSVTQALAHMELTRLIIAHRPETIAGAQRVVQVKDGNVLEVVRAISIAGLAEQEHPSQAQGSAD